MQSQTRSVTAIHHRLISKQVPQTHRSLPQPTSTCCVDLCPVNLCPVLHKVLRDASSVMQGGMDAIGGDLMCAILAEVRFRLPVPAMHAAGMYGHGFMNGGNSALLSGTGKPLQQTLADFAKVHQTWRWSAVSHFLPF